MSAFNTVIGSAFCPNCGHCADFEVQFKYGDTWQHVYRIGERLRWGGNDIGVPGHKSVLIEGIGGPCPHCAADNIDFDILVQDDELIRIEPMRGRRSASESEGFVILEP